MAKPLTAFGNTVAASYLRLVPGQEAPTRICWGRRNRSSLLRVPLDFPYLPAAWTQTYESGRRRAPTRSRWRGRPSSTGVPDGSALCHLLLAAVSLAVEEGLTEPGTPRPGERARG